MTEFRGSRRKPPNRRGADIVAARYRTQSFTVAVAALDRLALLVRREFGLAPEFGLAARFVQNCTLS
jgi:hypothetical protein